MKYKSCIRKSNIASAEYKFASYEKKVKKGKKLIRGYMIKKKLCYKGSRPTMVKTLRFCLIDYYLASNLVKVKH